MPQLRSSCELYTELVEGQGTVLVKDVKEGLVWLSLTLAAAEDLGADLLMQAEHGRAEMT